MMHPWLARKLTFPLHERLKGKRTLRWLERLETTQWLPPERLREYAFQRLKAHLQFAYEHVPYYRRLLDEHGLAPARVQAFEDFSRIPILTRANVRTEFEALQARPRMAHTQPMATGGSTGEPVTVLVDMERIGFGDAARLRAHRWFGLEPGAREIVLWGAPFELDRQGVVRRLRDFLINSRLLSAFDLGETALARYAAVISRWRPEKMFGYGSAFYLLAGYLRRRRWRSPRSLRAVFTTAERLFEFQREAIAEVFGCPVAVEYGARDAGVIANECPEGGLHIPIEGMHVEILGDRGDGNGEITVTNLDSFAFPIIRYRTGDLGSLDPTPCRCGRTLPRLRQIEGRTTDFVVTPDGRCLHALALIYPLRETPHVREFSVVQERIDAVRVMLVCEPGFSTAEERQLQAALARPLGAGVAIDIALVPEIPRTPSGKFRYVSSTVARPVIDELLSRVQP